jgi:phage/plasmid-associated DNA primase
MASANPVTAADIPGPSPSEMDAMVWAEINQTTQRKHCAGARSLNVFANEQAKQFMTPKGDERTNIIDQGERHTYNLGRDHVNRLFELLEACRKEGAITHYSERQGTPEAPRCGVMVDFDIITTCRKPALADRHYYRLAGALLTILQRDIDLAGQIQKIGEKRPTEAKLHIFFIIKPAAVALSAAQLLAQKAPAGKSLYKYGLHVLVPGVWTGRAYKKWLLRQLAADPAVASVMQELEAVGDLAKCVDPNSASVPVLFFGSCKRGGTPYVLGAALEAVVDLGVDTSLNNWVPPPVVRRVPDADLAKFNLVAELSLTHEAEYPDGAAPLVRKLEFECRPEIASKVQDWGERTAGLGGADGTPAGDAAVEELILAEHTLSTLTLHSPEARYLHSLLDLLGPEYATNRDKWRDVIFALANTSNQYKPLAVWFSHKCAHKWRDGGADALDTIWEDALVRREAFKNTTDRGPLTIASIAYWARTSNPARYSETMERSYFTMLTRYVYDYGGKLQHAMVAKVLFAMLGSKFCTDIAVGSRGAETHVWYEFVLPDQPMQLGEVWKWRRESEPDNLHIYISEKLSKVLDQVSEHIEEKRAAAADEGQAKYYSMLGKSFAGSKVNLFNDTFKNGIIRQATYLFRRRGFVKRLDTVPYLMGVQNGVLKVGARCSLIEHFHEYPISRFSTTVWKKFDAADPWTKLVLNAIADIIPEPDARDWILYHAAQGVSGDQKEGLFLIWEGGGQNGKSTFLRWVAKALGEYADKFNIQLLTCDREEADRPNSAVMKMKYLNYAYCEETSRTQALNDARMKELVTAGEVSGRDLNSKQETFTMHCNMVAASQFSFIIRNTDHGTWRRIAHYTSKTKFRRNPDPTNPFERQDDQRFLRQYSNDPQFLASVLSVLTHYYERLQNEYNGELKNVRSPTIDAETSDYRIGQDTVHRWISESVVLLPETLAGIRNTKQAFEPAATSAETLDYPLGVLNGYYNDWYAANVDRRRQDSAGSIKELENSALGKYLRRAPNSALVLRGCRVVLPGDSLRPGEEYLCKVEMYNGKTKDEWDREREQISRAAKAATLFDDGLPWWAARAPAPSQKPPGAAPDPPARPDNVQDIADDFDLVNLVADDINFTHSGRPPKPVKEELTDEDVDRMMSESFVFLEKYELDDVYG